MSEAPIDLDVVEASFDDDEKIVTVEDVSGDKPASFLAGTAKATIINKTDAPLQKTDFKVLLELTGAGLSEDRPGLDLVAVLDISESMRKEQRLEKLQRAMAFLIRKLSPIDRLSIVAFCNIAARYCPLRQVTEESQPQIESIVNNFTAAGGTDIPAGLYQALEVVKARRYTEDRTAAIMVMSDGKTDNKTDKEMDREISQLQMKDVPVFTFGFGADQDARVLNNIAKSSKGGTFSDVQNTDNLSLAFSQCLAGLLTVVVQDLKMTVTPLQSTAIEKVNAGDYPRPEDINVAGSVTVAFGDLYDKELRKVLVELILPKVESRVSMDFLRISLTYKSKGKTLNAPPILATVTRTEKPTEEERDEVVVELKRLRAARTIRKARELADKKNLGSARDELTNTQNELKNTVLKEPSELIDTLISELKQLFDYMIDQATYEKLGRPFALSAETSHALQRYAARGDIEKLRLFATARMNAYLEQAKLFDKDPNMTVASSVEDVKEEIVADPLAAIVAALSEHIKTAVLSLKAIEKILDTYGR